MHGLIAVVSVVAVLALAVWGVEAIFGSYSWVVYSIAVFFGLMALCAKFNSTS